MTARAIAYVRKSTAEVERRSITEQEADLRRQADFLGVEVVKVLAEEASAYAERERPVFTSVLRSVEAGEADVVICWSLDRFSRRGAGHVMGLVDKGLRIVSLDGIDTANENSRMQVAVMAEAARMESSRISSRVRRAKSAARDEGRWHAGRAPYGYRTEGKGRSLRLVIEPTEAKVVQAMAERLVAGDSITSLTRWLNESETPTPAGAAWKARGKGLHWTNMAVKAALIRPTLAGWLPHGDDVVRDEKGQPVVAHEAILRPDLWRQVQAALRARTATAPHSVSARGGRPPSHLLSGLLYCPCGWVLTASTQQVAGSEPRRMVPVYRCSAPRGARKGRHTSITGAVDDIMARRVLSRLGAMEPGPAMDAVGRAWAGLTGQSPDDPERRARAAAVEAAREEVDRVTRLVAKGLIDEADAERTLPPLRDALRKAEGRLADLGPPVMDVSFLLDLGATADDPEADPVGPGSAWSALPMDRRRLVVRSVVERIEVEPTAQGARDVAARLHPLWAGETGAP